MNNRKTNKDAVADLFNLITLYLGNTPSEDRCAEAMQFLLEGINKIDDAVVMSNFRLRWFEVKELISKHADPSSYRFIELQIERQINKIIDPEVKPLKEARR